MGLEPINCTQNNELRRWAIALGSNLADPQGALAWGWRAVVAALGLQQPRLSRCWTTAPAEHAHGPQFANAVGCGWSGIDIAVGFSCLQRIERAFGRDRPREGLHGPRPLDLDLIAIEGVRRHGPDLVLPHPRWHLRSFVAGPLAEVWPDLASDDGTAASVWAERLGVRPSATAPRAGDGA